MGSFSSGCFKHLYVAGVDLSPLALHFSGVVWGLLPSLHQRAGSVGMSLVRKKEEKKSPNMTKMTHEDVHSVPFVITGERN